MRADEPSSRPDLIDSMRDDLDRVGEHPTLTRAAGVGEIEYESQEMVPLHSCARVSPWASEGTSCGPASLPGQRHAGLLGTEFLLEPEPRGRNHALAAQRSPVSGFAALCLGYAS